MEVSEFSVTLELSEIKRSSSIPVIVRFGDEVLRREEISGTGLMIIEKLSELLESKI
jgi:hypothetical protein